MKIENLSRATVLKDKREPIVKMIADFEKMAASPQRGVVIEFVDGGRSTDDFLAPERRPTVSKNQFAPAQGFDVPENASVAMRKASEGYSPEFFPVIDVLIAMMIQELKKSLQAIDDELITL